MWCAIHNENSIAWPAAQRILPLLMWYRLFLIRIIVFPKIQNSPSKQTDTQMHNKAPTSSRGTGVQRWSLSALLRPGRQKAKPAASWMQLWVDGWGTVWLSWMQSGRDWGREKEGKGLKKQIQQYTFCQSSWYRNSLSLTLPSLNYEAPNHQIYQKLTLKIDMSKNVSVHWRNRGQPLTTAKLY